MYAAPAYWLYEMSQAALNPSRAFADAARLFFKNPANPLVVYRLGQDRCREHGTVRALDPALRQAGMEYQLDRGRRRAGAVRISTVWERPFCRLLHFERAFERLPRRPQPRLLIVAPMSGHYPTLLRGTVEGFLPKHDVYITEWVDARMVPVRKAASISTTTSTTSSSMLHVPAAATSMWWRSASPRFLCLPRSPAWRPSTTLCPGFHDPDGRADRYAGQSYCRSTRWPNAAAPNGSAATSSPRCRFRIRDSCATSIQASCNCTAS